MSSLPGAALRPCGTLTGLLLGLLLTAGSPASAKVLPSPWSGNIAFVSAKSKAGSIEDSGSQSPPGPAPWGGNLFTSASNDTTGASAFALTTLTTSISDSVFGVSSSGFGSAENGGVNRAGALVYVVFVVERTQSYTAYPVVGEGSFGSRHMVAFLANLQSPHLALDPLLPGETHNGRLAPGIYCLYYEAYYRDETATGAMNNAGIQVAFFDVPDPLIDQHPQSQTVAPGANASFAVGASGLAAANASETGAMALTYQWRRNYQNLVDGGRISGATSSQLQIANVAVSDTGTYDCVVTQTGGLQEPSSLARLTVSGTADVGDPPAGAGVSLTLPAPPAPMRWPPRAADG